MTEKRFAVTQTTLGSGIYDYQVENELCESYDEDAYREVCKKLNEFDKENNELKIHILQQQKHAKRLENENIQMYTTIKESYKSERTQLGKNTLRQLAEALKVELE